MVQSSDSAPLATESDANESSKPRVISVTDVTPALASVSTPKTTSKSEMRAVNVGDNNNSKNTIMKQIDADSTRPHNSILSSPPMADSTLNARPVKSPANSIAATSNTVVEISNSAVQIHLDFQLVLLLVYL